MVSNIVDMTAFFSVQNCYNNNEPPRDKKKKKQKKNKTKKKNILTCAPSKDSDQPDQSLHCAQLVAKDPSFLHADREDSDQTGRMPRLI